LQAIQNTSSGDSQGDCGITAFLGRAVRRNLNKQADYAAKAPLLSQCDVLQQASKATREID